MGRSTKGGNSRGNTETKHTLLKRRCSINKCRKRAMDVINEKYLCRVHSPIREGFIGGEY